MQDRDGDTDAAILRETPEEAARAIAGALEFLRNETTAIGISDVGVLLGLAHARLRHYCPTPHEDEEQT